jgi:hypothetical protein
MTVLPSSRCKSARSSDAQPGLKLAQLGSPHAWFAKTPLDRYIVPPPELPQSTIFLCAGSEFLIQGR